MSVIRRLKMRIASAIEGHVPSKMTRVCPMTPWLLQRGLTQVWLAEKMGVAKNTIYMWFKKIEIPSLARRRQMSGITRGEINLGELNAFFDSSVTTPRRKEGRSAKKRIGLVKPADRERPDDKGTI
jgi:hypothetical protein